jgi:hypothetical protein
MFKLSDNVKKEVSFWIKTIRYISEGVIMLYILDFACGLLSEPSLVWVFGIFIWVLVTVFWVRRFDLINKIKRVYIL